MLNLYYDFFKSSWFQPYLGIGAGVAKIDFDIASTVAIRRLPAAITIQLQRIKPWPALGFVLSPQLTLDIGYRYFEAPDRRSESRRLYACDL